MKLEKKCYLAVHNMYDFCSIWKLNMASCVNYAFWSVGISNLFFSNSTYVMDILHGWNILYMTLYRVMFYFAIKNPRWLPIQDKLLT